MEPRPHQRDALKAIESIGASGRALVVMACGTGKTKVGRDAAVARAGESGLVMVVVPSKWLVRQTYLDWLSDSDSPLDALLVYSDPAVGEAAATTDESVIAEWLGRDVAGMRLMVCTYQSADRVAAAYASTPDLPVVDAMVLDEGHWTAGPSGRAYALPLYDDKIPATTRITLTATARVHPDGDGTQDVVSMSDPALYGERVFELTFGEAIQRGLLADYRVAVVVVTDEEVHQVLLAQQHLPRGEELSTGQVAAQIAVSRAVDTYDLRRVVGFHSRVDRSKTFTRTLGRVASAITTVPVQALHVDSTTSHADRQAALQGLAQPGRGATVLSNVAIFTEGVDVPAADGVVFADPKASKVAITQAVGRALRLHPDKDQSVIILPVYLAPGENAEQVLASSEYRHVWAVLSALRDHDERMDAALTAKRIELGEREVLGGSEQFSMPGMIDMLGPDEVLHGRMREALSLHLLTGATESWLTRYGKLKAYMQFTGVMPRHDYVTPQGDALGRFVQAQKAARAKGVLLPSREGLLEELPGWTWPEKKAGPIDREALHALVVEWHEASGIPEPVERHEKLASLAVRCESLMPDFKYPYSKFRAHINNAVWAMEALYRRMQMRRAEGDVLDKLAPNRTR